MKQYLIIASVLLLSPLNHLCAQTDYCSRISAAKVAKTDSGYTTYVSPHIKDIAGDKKQAFFKRFHRRFDYILINKVNLEGADLYKMRNDTAALNRHFCELFTQQKELSGYFDVLSNAEKGAKQMFTVAEMMQVAARFFWLERKESGRWTYYICIGNNGQKESNYERDYSVLEAFCFEAIFSYLDQRKSPRFFIAADKYFDTIKRVTPEADRQDTAVILAARQSLYYKMEQDADLRQALLRYYRRYGNTCGFRLSDSDIKL